MVICVGCQWQLKPHSDAAEEIKVTVARFDRIENLYLTTGEPSALQQMNTDYPMQTRTLIEDVLRIGKVDDPDINTKFLVFFQDSTLQAMLRDVQRRYADLGDIEEALSDAFERLRAEMPGVELPQVYAQIGSFDQSIVVGHNTLGISLDKYLGADYPFYQTYYEEPQRRMMTPSMIVPDCLSFFILSLYPLPDEMLKSKAERDLHMGKIQWMVNQLMRQDVFSNASVEAVDRYMRHHKNVSMDMLLREVRQL
jgi:hypothetical protein